MALFLKAGCDFPIRLRFEREYRDNIDELNRLFIPVRTNGAASIAINTSPAMGQSGASSTSSGMTGMGSAQSPQSQVSVQQSSFVSSSLLNQQPQDEIAYVPLSELADLKIITGPPMISSENGQLRAIVYMNVRGRDMG